MRWRRNDRSNLFKRGGVISVTLKRCGHCTEHKPTSNFYRSKYYKDGLAIWCKSCDAEDQRRRRKLKPHVRKKDYRYKARMRVNNALASGKLIRPDKCSKCNSTGLIQGHHEDYDKPLEVIWVCSKCHKDIHARQ